MAEQPPYMLYICSQILSQYLYQYIRKLHPTELLFRKLIHIITGDILPGFIVSSALVANSILRT